MSHKQIVTCFTCIAQGGYSQGWHTCSPPFVGHIFKNDPSPNMLQRILHVQLKVAAVKAVLASFCVALLQQRFMSKCVLTCFVCAAQGGRCQGWQVRCRCYCARVSVWETWFISAWHDSCMCDSLICVPPSLLRKDIFVCDATHSRVTRLDHVWQHTATYCNILQCLRRQQSHRLRHSVRSHCNKVQHTATHDLIMCDMTHACAALVIVQGYLCVRHDAFMRDMTHSCVTEVVHVRRDLFMCDMTRSCVTWLIRVWQDSLMRDVTHSRVTWLIHAWRDSFMCDVTDSCVTCFIQVWRALFVCGMTHSYATWLVRTWHDSYKCALVYICVYVFMWDMTHPRVTWLFIWDMTHPCVTGLVDVWHDSCKCALVDICVYMC